MTWLWLLSTVVSFIVAIRSRHTANERKIDVDRLDESSRKYRGLWEQSEGEIARLREELKETIQQANKRIHDLKDQNKLTVANSEAILEKASEERHEIDQVNRNLRHELDTALTKLESIREAIQS